MFNTEFVCLTQVFETSFESVIQGKSAYETWLEQGNTGTEQDFLDSLKDGESLPTAEEVWL